jgi:hypothetical protein
MSHCGTQQDVPTTAPGHRTLYVVASERTPRGRCEMAGGPRNRGDRFSASGAWLCDQDIRNGWIDMLGIDDADGLPPSWLKVWGRMRPMLVLRLPSTTRPLFIDLAWRGVAPRRGRRAPRPIALRMRGRVSHHLQLSICAGPPAFHMWRFSTPGVAWVTTQRRRGAGAPNPEVGWGVGSACAR